MSETSHHLRYREPRDLLSLPWLYTRAQNRERRALYSRAIRDVQMAPFRRLVVLQESKPFGLTCV